MSDTTNAPRTEAPMASAAMQSEHHEAETPFFSEGAASFADAETREILNLLGESDAAGGCCGGGCCSV
ncbi:hypothetical protein [Leucobacter sp. gxy201]|uniref:hypothetical protein n=1 Tax=Leucobacter sp. gxy201 TaxID=2957200 RepID=UPI003DA1032D